MHSLGNQHVIDIMKKGMNSKWTPDIHHMFPRHIRYTITVYVHSFFMAIFLILFF